MYIDARGRALTDIPQSTLLRLLGDKAFSRRYDATLRTEKSTFQLDADVNQRQELITVDVLDVPGSLEWTEKVGSAVGAVIAYDAGEPNTEIHVDKWSRQVTDWFGDIPRVVVGTKVDLPGDRTSDDPQYHLAPYPTFLTSATSKTGINNAFQALVFLVFVRRPGDRILNLPREMLLRVLEFLDPDEFILCSHLAGGNRALYRNQLRKLLHNSPFAKYAARDAKSAYVAYHNILSALAKARELNGRFPHEPYERPPFHNAFVVGPDYCTYRTFDFRNGHELWSLTTGEHLYTWPEQVADVRYIDSHRLLLTVCPADGPY